MPSYKNLDYYIPLILYIALVTRRDLFSVIHLLMELTDIKENQSAYTFNNRCFNSERSFDIPEIRNLHLQRSTQIHVRPSWSHESNIDTDMSQRRILGFAMAGHCTGIGGIIGMPSIFRRSTSVQTVLDEGRYHTRMANAGFLILLVRGIAFTLQ